MAGLLPSLRRYSNLSRLFTAGLAMVLSGRVRPSNSCLPHARLLRCMPRRFDLGPTLRHQQCRVKIIFAHTTPHLPHRKPKTENSFIRSQLPTSLLSLILKMPGNIPFVRSEYHELSLTGRPKVHGEKYSYNLLYEDLT